MKRIFALATALLMVLALAACGTQPTSTKPTDAAPTEAVAAPELFVLGLDASFPPMGFTNDEGEIVGFDIDVAKAVCDKLGMELQCTPIDWAAKELELNSGNIDCIWNGMTVTEEREESMNLSDAYMANRQVIVVRNDSDIKSIADLAGKKVAVQLDSSGQSALEASEIAASIGEIIKLEEYLTALMDVEAGNVDAVVIDEVVASYTILQNNKPLTILADEPLASEEYAIGFKKDNTDLRNKVNDALIELAKDGTLAQISTEWFGSDITTIGK